MSLYNIYRKYKNQILFIYHGVQLLTCIFIIAGVLRHWGE